MDIKTRIRVALGIEDEVVLGYEGKLKDGTIIVAEADALAEGVEVRVLTEDGTQIAVPVGAYELEDGTTFVVEEEGIVASLGEAEVEVEAGDKDKDDDYGDDKDKEEMNANDELITEIGSVVMELLEEVKKDLDMLRAELDEVRGENLAKDENIVDLQNENIELSKKLDEKPATNNVVTNKFSKKTKLSAMDYNKLTPSQKFMYDINNNN